MQLFYYRLKMLWILYIYRTCYVWISTRATNGWLFLMWAFWRHPLCLSHFRESNRTSWDVDAFKFDLTRPHLLVRCHNSDSSFMLCSHTHTITYTYIYTYYLVIFDDMYSWSDKATFTSAVPQSTDSAPASSGPQSVPRVLVQTNVQTLHISTSISKSGLVYIIAD